MNNTSGLSKQLANAFNITDKSAISKHKKLETLGRIIIHLYRAISTKLQSYVQLLIMVHFQKKMHTRLSLIYWKFKIP